MRVLEKTGHLGLPLHHNRQEEHGYTIDLWEHRKDLTVFAPMIASQASGAEHTLSEMTACRVSPSTAVGISRETGRSRSCKQSARDLVVFDRYRSFFRTLPSPDDYLHLER